MVQRLDGALPGGEVVGAARFGQSGEWHLEGPRHIQTSLLPDFEAILREAVLSAP